MGRPHDLVHGISVNLSRGKSWPGNTSSKQWTVGRWAKYGACGRRVLACDFAPSFPARFYLFSSSSIFVILHTPSTMPQAAGCHGQARTPLRERWGGHQAWSRRLPSQRPARDLPRPSPHAPNLRRDNGRCGGRRAKRRGEARRTGHCYHARS